MTSAQRVTAAAAQSQLAADRSGENHENILRGNTRLAAVALGMGLLLRLGLAWNTFLNPDEAFHYFLSNQVSFSRAYRASFFSAHPPLFVLVLYGWHRLGISELWLRLPSVIGGTLSCWLAYKWLLRITSRTTSLSGLILLSFSPLLISLESELRQYSLLLLFVTCALYCLERSVQENSARWAALFGLALWLAICVHYSGLLFAGMAGLYGIVQLLQARPKLRLWMVWIASELGAGILGLYFFETHISRIKATVEIVGETYLKKSTYHAGDHALAFILANTYRLFHYIAGNPVVGPAMLVLYVIGLLALIRHRGTATGLKVSAKQLAFNLGAPMLVAWAAALTGFYPYGGTRHCVLLAPFLVAGSSLGLDTVLARRGPWLAAGLMTLSLMAPSFPGPSMKIANQRRTLMRRVVERVHLDLPAGSLVLIDRQSLYPFRYYFCPRETVRFDANPPGFSCGGYRVWQNPGPWMLTPEQLPRDVHDAVERHHPQPGTKMLIFQTGWSVSIEPEMRSKLAQAGCRRIAQAGDNIVACEVRVDDILNQPGLDRPPLH